ncbi:heat shock transcription factor, X-linked member 3 [Choloepus didactylus]|uniref:heat shock transcription factor, X-linked member 3 n=1 Tax=Choloepus didactylus TaxID=27675 RepID=UPI00189FA400|nr:heat shock transcription factor, X-linked member 3 [Choloepus didactylus]
MDSREFLNQHSDQAVSPGPGPPDNLQPQDQNQSTENEEEGNDVLGLAFPRKLWMLVENDTFKSVYWNNSGDTVIIEAELSEAEILHRTGTERFFETDSLKSFFRQLNLYGFSKIRQTDFPDHFPGNKRMMIYRNSNFKRDNPLLLQNIQRKGAGAPPMGLPVYPDGATIMFLYNTCYSILLAAISVMSPNEPFDGQQEGPSDYHCALCEQFKDNPAP